jgi:hypothetical protein
MQESIETGLFSAPSSPASVKFASPTAVHPADPLPVTTEPNVMVQWIEFLRIWGVPGSNLSSETGISEVPHGFPQFLQENTGIVPQIT